MPQESKESQDRAELAEPREACPSGAMRVAADAEVPSADERLGLRISRPNAPVLVLPSILVDASYLQTVASVVARMRARRRKLALVAACAFLCGALTLPLTAELVHQMTAPVTSPLTATSVAKHVGASLPTPAVPVSASPSSEPPRRARMDQRMAARQVHDAQELRRAGQLSDARRLLTEVLKDRSGYPPAFAAMAELELDRGQTDAALRSARLAVRALPGSAQNWGILGRAYTAAGRHAESAHARARAAELHRLQR